MSCNCRIRKLLSFAPVLRFDRARRSPERARIDAIRIELQHLVVELSRGRRRPGYAVEITDVLPGLFNDLGAVVVPRSLMPGDHGARIERLDFIERRDPFAAPLRIGLDRKSTRLNSSHGYISYAVFCLKKKKNNTNTY